MIITLLMNPSSAELNTNIEELINAARRTIAILMVLLATRIVLNSFSGLLYSFIVICDFLLLCDLNFSISSGVNEKNATSEADIRADPRRSIIRIMSQITILISGGLTTIPENGNRKEFRYMVSN